MANRNFYRKQFSNYLGENRAILDIYGGYETPPTPTPSPTSITPTPTPTLTPSPTSPGLTPTPTLTPSPTVAPVFETEYQAILTRGSQLGFNLPGYSEKIKQNQLVIDLKNAGLWTKLGVFYMFKLDTSSGASPGFTFINWITPANPVCSINIYAGGSYPTHTTNSGWTMSQNNYVELGTNVGVATTNAINITTSGNSEGLYYVEYNGPSTSARSTMWSTTNNAWNQANYNNIIYQQIFRQSDLTAAYDFTGLGFKAASIDGRPDTDLTVVFRNGGVSTTATKLAVDAAIGGGQMRLNSTFANQTHGWTCGMWFSAGGASGNGFFSGTDVPALETIINSYMTS